MSAFSKIGDAFDATMDWVMEGSMPWSLTKLFGVATAATIVVGGVIASPFIYAGYQNDLALQTRLEYLDAHPTGIFNSISGCTQSGIDEANCIASRQEAMDVSNSLGTSLSYSSSGTCSATFGECQRVVTHGMVMVGKVMVPTTNTSYHPHVAGWQAAKDDPLQAVPLYRSAQEGMLIRQDGAQFPAP